MNNTEEIPFNSNLPVPIEFIERRIYLIRGQKVMLDTDLAELYQVKTGNLNKSVHRNIARFPKDFMFQLTKDEAENLRFQFGISSSEYGGRRYLPYAFTEHGVAMLSSVLNSNRAILMNILIVRAFIQLRQILASNKDIERKILEMERRQARDGSKIDIIYKIVQRLITTPEPPRKRIGFKERDETD